MTKGSRVGLIMPNGVRWAQIAIALTRIGAVLVPLSTLLTGPELVAQLEVASVRYLISVQEFRGHRYLDDVRPELAKLPALRDIWLADDLPSGGADADVDALAGTVVPADPMLVMFTSGSSGPPKGVIHSHGSALTAVRAGLVGPPHRRRHPAVCADAVLLGRRVRHRSADRARSRARRW